MKNQTVTIKDIANFAEVSTATVSRYINRTRKLNPETSCRIQKAIEHFNYIPNDNARALRSRSEKIIGIIFPDISNSFFARIFKSIEELLFEEKIFVLLCNSNENEEKEREYLYRLLQKRVDAIIIAPTGSNNELLRNICQTIPIIIFDRRQDDIITDQLYANDFASCQQLTNHVLNCGHRKIAYTLGASCSSASDLRYKGFLQVMNANKIPSENCLIIHAQDESACRKEFRKLLIQDKISAAIITSPKKLNWFLMERNQFFLKGGYSTLSFAGYATANEFDISEVPLTGLLQKEEIYATKLVNIVLSRLEKPRSKIKNIELSLTFYKGNSIVTLN